MSMRTTVMFEVDDTAAATVQFRINIWIRFLETESDDVVLFRVVALSRRFRFKTSMNRVKMQTVKK